MTFTLRSATPDDAQAIAEVHVASWRAAFRGVLSDEYLDGLDPAQRRASWDRVLGSGSSFSVAVAEVGSEIVGFASVGLSDEGRDGEMTLYTLYLHPDAIGKGIGRALLAEAERRMAERGGKIATLRVLTANNRARRVYERAGWAAILDSVHMEDAWGQPVETIRYTKSLA